MCRDKKCRQVIDADQNINKFYSRVFDVMIFHISIIFVSKGNYQSDGIKQRGASNSCHAIAKAETLRMKNSLKTFVKPNF